MNYYIIPNYNNFYSLYDDTVNSLALIQAKLSNCIMIKVYQYCYIALSL